MYKLKRATKIQTVNMLYKLLLLSTVLLFLVPMILGSIHKNLELMDTYMFIWTNALSITLGCLGYIASFFGIFAELCWRIK